MTKLELCARSRGLF